MEQKQYFPKAQKRKLRRERIKKWFSETFRAHSKEEYKEFFMRGFDGKEGLNKVYPWVYMRMLVVCFVMFAATAFFMRVTGNAITFPTLGLLGAVLVNLPFITLIYELCPKTDISFLRLMIVLLVGGLVSVILTELGYLAFSPENAYASVAWTAVLEEVAKIIPAIAAIMIMKKRQNPLACFAIAAAVGAGISIIEDMGYIIFNSFEQGVDLSIAITTSIMRSVSGVATHTVWAGYVGWIFSKYKKPLLDARFYGVCLMSMALHFLWDLIAANEQLWSILGMLFGFIFCICFTRWLVKKERKLVLEGEGVLPLALQQPEQPAAASPETVAEPNATAAPNATAETVETNAADNVFEEFASPATTAEQTAAQETAVTENLSVAEEAVAADTAVSAGAPAVACESVATDGSRAWAGSNVYAARKAFPEDSPEIKTKKRARYSQAANIIATIAAIILGIVAINACSADIGYGYETRTFEASQKQQFIDFVQDGYSLTYDWDRPLDKSDKDYYAFSVEDNEYTAITQIVDGKYYYSYFWTETVIFEDGKVVETLPAEWHLSDISVIIDDETYYCVEIPVNIELDGLNDDGAEPEKLSCFIINENVVACYCGEIFGYTVYTVVLNNMVFYGLSTVIGYAVSMAAVIFVGALLFLILKLQSKKLAKELAAIDAAATADATAVGNGETDGIAANESADAVNVNTDANESAGDGSVDGAEENSENGDKKDGE